jgi:restriction system protein
MGMTIPTTSSILTPLLKLCGDKKEHSIQEAIEYLSNLFRLSADDKRKLLPSGGDLIFSNRVAWARTILKHSRLIESVRRGYFRITDRGSGALSQNVTINNTFLKQFPEYLEFIRPKRAGDEINTIDTISPLDINIDKGKTPEEIFDDNYETITDVLISEILEKLVHLISLKKW